jgi:metabolite-proton symporter
VSAAAGREPIGDAATQRPVTPQDIRTVVASSVIGTAVEWYDFFLFGVAAGLVLDDLYFPNDDPLIGTLLAYTTFALGFVARPIGGLLFGHIGDRRGRKTTLVTTMLIMGVATFLMGAIPTYEQIGIAAPILLIVLRLAQGLAIGGEWGGAVLMAVEYAPPRRRGFYGSFPQLGLAVGLVLGTGVFTLLSAVLDDAAFRSYGWRIAFFASLVLVLIGLYIRLKVLETPAFAAVKAAEREAKVPFVELVRDRRSRRHLLLGMGSRWAEGVAFNTWAVFVIAYATDTLGMRRGDVLLAVMVSACVMGALIPVFGHLCDRLGRRQMFATGVVLFGLSAYPAFAIFETGSFAALLGVLVVVLGVFYPVMYAPQSSLYAELFPTTVRYSGISFVYQFSGIVASGLTPLVLTALLGRGGDEPWLLVGYVVATAVVSLGCVLAIRPADMYREDLDAVRVEPEAVATR